MSIDDLPHEWRDRAELLARYGGTEQATALKQCADDLERALATGGDEELSIAAAAMESGYSADHIGRLIRQGLIPNVGTKHRPKIRRRDLPKKPKGPEPVTVTTDVALSPRLTAAAIGARSRKAS